MSGASDIPGNSKRLNIGGWNYRVMRHVPAAPEEPYYAVHEVYYTTTDEVETWTVEPCGSPFGATLEEMVADLAWIMLALSKPVLDAATGKEVEPAAMLTDDLLKMLADEREKATVQ